MTWCQFGYPPCGGCEACIGAQRAYYDELERHDRRVVNELQRHDLLDAYFNGQLVECRTLTFHPSAISQYP